MSNQNGMEEIEARTKGNIVTKNGRVERSEERWRQ